MFRPLRLFIFVTGCGLGLATRAAEPVPHGTASPASTSSTLAGTDWWHRLGLHDLQGAPSEPAGHWLVVVFISPECPVANAELPILNALAKEFAPRGFAFIGAYADPGIEPAELRRHAADSGLAFLTVDDRAQRLAQATGATYTPEAFVFSRDGSLLYRGRIDDRVRGFGLARPAANAQEDLRNVLAALAAGQAGPFPNRPGFGCALPEPVKP